MWWTNYLGLLRKKGQWVYGRSVGQLHQTLTWHTKVRAISRHRDICVHTSGQRAQCYIFSSRNQTSLKTHGWGEDGDGWSRDVSDVHRVQVASSQTSQQIWEVISALSGRAGGNHVLCVYRVCVGYRERGVCGEASACSGTRPGCGRHGGLHGWDQVRSIFNVLSSADISYKLCIVYCATNNIIKFSPVCWMDNN